MIFGVIPLDGVLHLLNFVYRYLQIDLTDLRRVLLDQVLQEKKRGWGY